jgi:hypothetical protein
MPIGYAEVAGRILSKAVETFAERLVVYLLPERKQPGGRRHFLKHIGAEPRNQL